VVERVITIGVYGFTSEQFFRALVDARVDLFCDVRARRGVRGREYAFANATRLTSRLDELGIRYQHFPELAPTMEIRAQQQAADTASRTAKRSRSELSQTFTEGYEALLDEPAAIAAVDGICRSSSRPVLLCVERLPAACHRSLIAARIRSNCGAEIENMLP
jgi:uncharacterized protein (DUF488 family)